MRVIVAALALSTSARATEPREGPSGRPPMPEPIFTETVTDLDGDEAGEIELEIDGATILARRGGARQTTASAELEWLATRRLGLRLEPGLVRSTEAGESRHATFALGGGVSWKLYQDFEHDFHTQLEIVSRLPRNATRIAEAGEPGQPVAADLRSGVRVGLLTLRGGLGVGIGDTAARSPPLRMSIAALTGFTETARYGFLGLELDADGARRAPFIVAPNVVADCTSVGLPFRVAFGVPLSLGARETEPSLGIYLRLFFVTERELEYGRTGR